MTHQSFIARTEEDTIELGRRLAAGWPRPCVVLLIGDLGAGKTTMTKGIAEGLGVARADDVSSPTFPLIHEYGDAGEMYHIDLYRLDTEREVESLGLDDLFARNSVVVMEWAERFPALLPASRIEIRITADADELRRVTVTELP
jgi:tRNA threonylcarbamoyladenosine biosynthesis protein TsaE